MYGFGLLALMITVAIGVFVYVKPALAPISVPGQGTTTPTQAIEAARGICLSSAKAALQTDLMIAGLNCPVGQSGFPSKACAQQSSEGAQAYAKYERAVQGCSQQ